MVTIQKKTKQIVEYARQDPNYSMISAHKHLTNYWELGYIAGFAKSQFLKISNRGEITMSTDNVAHTHFITFMNQLAREINDNAREKGFWSKERNNGEMLMLVVSELSECLEGLRQGNPPSDKIPSFTSAGEELADAIIRILDIGEARGWRVPEAIIAKMAYNKTREHMHGGKKF